MYLSGGLTHQYIICLIKTESFLKYDFTKETNIGFQLFFCSQRCEVITFFCIVFLFEIEIIKIQLKLKIKYKIKIFI